MRQFAVCDLGRKSLYRLALVLQSDEFRALDTRLVAPMVRCDEGAPIPGINPIIAVDGLDHILRLDQMVALRSNRLGDVVGEVEDKDYRIQSALDRLFSTI